MIETFSKSGVSFKYPANWTIEEETDDDGDWVVTLQTPATAMLIVTYRQDAEPAELADETLEALQADYPDLESQPTAEKIAGRVALGHDIDFITLDLPVCVQVRVLDLGEATLHFFWQMADAELDRYEPLMNSVLASVQIASE